VIPARGGSKGIPKKNIAPCGGRPLLAWTADAVRGSSLITDNILSSDDEEIIAVGREYGLRAPFVRPEELSRYETPAPAVIRHAVDWAIRHDGY